MSPFKRSSIEACDILLKDLAEVGERFVPHVCFQQRANGDAEELLHGRRVNAETGVPST